MPELTYLEAINAALHDEMEADPRVFCMGEDVGRQGGAFGATKGLQQAYGELRSIDTPVAEAGIAGVAIGAAMAGQRPVAEMQFGDFVSIAFDQIVTCAAKMHYRIGWAVPMVVRCPNGGGVGGGPYHSENVEAWFHHHAGLKIVCPATADRRLRASARVDPGSQPGRLLRAQVPLPAREGRRRHGRRRPDRADRQGARRPARHRPLDHHVRLDGAAVAGGRRHARRPRAPRSR